jgi:hypothetical protein
MSPSQVVIRGTLKPDGTLDLDEKPNLPAGRVQVTLQAVPEPTASGPGWWEVLQRIWREQAASGFKGRTKEEIDADVQQLRDELEEHANRIERLQEEAQRAREDAKARPRGKPEC